eukprot:CAMPEP_0184322702 /NCGR_PEP_ID=MMETSP1049-20130417/126102_1 /TAXON_ID=77928 /ORGANISM="Proteomonas sulcata, Strain CCMP704" /LENGTH=226 /DNA_ID=CAMNT_0026643933 /DNA_START=1 /DNA_END=681 /DNA_ORIENTATION=+
MAEFCHHCRGLTSIALHTNGFVTDSTLILIGKKVKGIRDLSFVACPMLSDVGLIRLIDCANLLQNLVLENCDAVTNLVATHIADRLADLRVLSMHKCKGITDWHQVTAILRHCQNLRWADFSGTSIDEHKAKVAADELLNERRKELIEEDYLWLCGGKKEMETLGISREALPSPRLPTCQFGLDNRPTTDALAFNPEQSSLLRFSAGRDLTRHGLHRYLREKVSAS